MIAPRETTDPLAEARQYARDNGLPWSLVQEAYRMLKQAERDKRERDNEVRRAAWCMATASRPRCWPFWRHGFIARFGRRVERSDYTAIPGYDEIAQQIAGMFPEYAGPDGCQRLFDFLLSPYERLPDRMTLYDRALGFAWELLERSRDLGPEPPPGDF